MFVNIFCTVVHVPFCYYLAITLDMKVRGAAIASLVHLTLRFAIILIILRFSKFYKNMVALTDPDNFMNMKQQFVFSLQCGSMFILS